MKNGTMHMGGHTTGAARLGATCSTSLIDAAIAAPLAQKPWHATTAEQVPVVFTTDRPSRRLSERFP